MKISEHIKKIREFYTKDRNKWGQGALLLDTGGYCLLGAAAAVLSNKHAIDTRSDGADFEEMGDWRELDDIKGERELLAFENFFAYHTEVGGQGMAVEDWNDGISRTRYELLTKLRNLEALALEVGV